MQDPWFKSYKPLKKDILMQDPDPKCRHFSIFMAFHGIFAKKSNKKSNPILSDFFPFPDF